MLKKVQEIPYPHLKLQLEEFFAVSDSSDFEK